jgi:hypothetical protein
VTIGTASEKIERSIGDVPGSLALYVKKEKKKWKKVICDGVKNKNIGSEIV